MSYLWRSYCVLCFLLVLQLIPLVESTTDIFVDGPPYFDAFTSAGLLASRITVVSDHIYAATGLGNGLIQIVKLARTMMPVWITQLTLNSRFSATATIHKIMEDTYDTATPTIIICTEYSGNGVVIKISQSSGAMIQSAETTGISILDMVMLSSSQIGIVGADRQVLCAAVYGVMNRLLYSDYSLNTDNGFCSIYQLFPYGSSYAFLGSTGDGGSFIQGLVASSFLSVGISQTLSYANAQAMYFSKGSPGKGYILTIVKNGLQGAYLFTEAISAVGLFILPIYDSGWSLSTMNIDGTYLMMTTSYLGNQDVNFKLIDSSFIDLPLTEDPDISNLNIDYGAADPASPNSWFFIGHQRNTQRMGVVKITIGTKLTCSGRSVSYFNQECLDSTMSSCHPLCSSCLKPNDIRACVIPYMPAQVSLFAALCPLNKVYSSETDSCRQVTSEGCSGCPNLCFSSPTPRSCVTQCTAGNYFDASTQTCQACSSYCTVCTNANYCQTCATRSIKIYKLSGNIECGLTCPSGYSINTNNDCQECPAHCNICDSSGICSDCLDGYYLDAIGPTCQPCAAGTYLYAQSSSPTSCFPCLPGYYNPFTGQSKCTTCGIGTYNPNYKSTDSSACLDCPEGTYNDAIGKGSCTECPEGTANKATGSKIKDACQECPKGSFAKYTKSSECTLCPPGTSSDVRGLKTDCPQCSPGSYNSLSGQLSCQPCIPGTFNPAQGSILSSACKQCYPGSYNPDYGKASCRECDPGKYNPGYGSTSLGDCLDCMPGTYNDSPGQAICTKCLPGTANSRQGSTDFSACISCPPGKYSELSGQAECSLCVPGTFQPNFSATSKLDCQLCPQGRYNPDYSSADCTACSPGTYNPNTGSISIDDCLLCPKGSYNNLQGQGQCSLCPKGTMNPKIGSISLSACANCGMGYYNDQLGKEKCIPCDSGTSNSLLVAPSKSCCIPCAPGLYSPYPAQPICRPCAPGTYCSDSGASKCTLCPMHTYNPDYGKSSLDSCLACPSGTMTYSTGQDYCVKGIEHCAAFYSGTIRCQSCDSPYYLQEGDGGSVLDSCLLECIDGYYKGTAMKCEPCNPFCLTCYGPEKSQCNECALSYQGTCVEKCPSHYYPLEHLCYECWYSCLDCSSGGSLSCLSCRAGFLFHKGQCLKSCPEKYYADTNKGACVPCESPCVLCRSSIECLSCISGFYLMQHSSDSSVYICSPAVKCSANAYFNTTLNKCEPCDSACLSCSGPTAKDCDNCNYLMNYTKLASNECRIPNCQNSQYLALNLINKEVTCKDCIASCKRCDGPNLEDCIECADNIPPLQYLDSMHVLCQNSTTAKKITKGVCGDGVRSIIEECDDGNKKNGDGCSSNCEVEYGYECHATQFRDVCIDVLPPQAFLKKNAESAAPDGKQLFMIVFTEFVAVEGTAKDLMKVEIRHLKKDCYYSWNADLDSSGASLKQFQFELSVYCSTKGTEELVITFLNQESIHDRANNGLSTSMIKAKLYPMSYISSAEKRVLDSAGSAVSISSFLAFGVAIFIILFQSFALTSFYLFVDLSQLISYLPLLNIYIPENYLTFINNYLTIKQLTIPWQLLPDWIPSPKLAFLAFITKPFNQNFQLAGLNSMSFLYNFADQLITWLLLLTFYIILAVLCKCISKKKCERIHQWKASYEFNGIFRVLMECYLQMCFCAILNIWNYYQKNSATSIISLAGAAVALYLCGAFLVITARMLSGSAEKLNSPIFRASYGTLIEDIYLGSSWTKSYTALYLFRRLVYACLLNVLYPYPILQMCLIILFVSVPIKFFFCINPPYNATASNVLSIYNEFYFFITLVSLLILNTISFSAQTAKILGWTLIGFVILSLLGTWALLLPPLIKEAYIRMREYIRNLCANRKQHQPTTKKVKANKKAVSAALEITPTQSVNFEDSERAKKSQVVVIRMGSRSPPKRASHPHDSVFVTTTTSEMKDLGSAKSKTENFTARKEEK